MAAVAVSGCGQSGFKVKGNVKDAGGKTLVLEKADFHGRWTPVDSVKIKSDGDFSISSASPASPEVYRLSLGDAFVYLPVDSIENITLTTSLKEFGRDFSLEGSDNARLLAAFEKELLALQAPDSAAMADFKRTVYARYLKEGKGSILSYYILTKFYEGQPLYDPTDPADAAYYAAVATQFEQYRPGDPHGRMVRQVSIDAMRKRNSQAGKQNVYHAAELAMIDIALPDEKGNVRRLSETVGKGKPVVLVFSLMNAPESPAFNRKVKELQSRGADIFHVCFDTGQYEWREAAANLPWVTVLDPGGSSSTCLVDYNVQSLPALFVYNAKGELIDRPANFDAVKL